MTLETLLNIHGRIQWGEADKNLQAKAVCFDSREVSPGCVYVAIRGHSSDGHQYLPQATEAGAIAVVVEDFSLIPAEFKGVVVEVLDARLSLQLLSQKFYGSPGEGLLSIAVTGTNGKTSTTAIVEYLLNAQDQLCGVIGTIDHHIANKVWETQLTTPDPVTLQSRLKDFTECGGKSFIIEASSHALDQNRINQGFDVTMFTNLSRDHLDYHQNMDQYFDAKAKLFKASMLKDDRDCMAVVNIDDLYGQRLVPMIEGRRVYTFGKGEGCDLRFAIVNSHLNGTDINLTLAGGYNFLIQSPLIGEHNAYNLVGGLAVIYGMGFDLQKAASDFIDFSGIPGRMQKIKGPQGVFGFVDYAHTPDALEQSILSLKPLIAEGKKLITVFGCGGDRDPGKRPIMGELANRLSDLTIVTSDNPRTEEPAQIVSEICEGFVHVKGAQFLPIVDREEAIQKACDYAEPGDAILVAGKGHETYQIIGDQKLHFDD
ncbi:MAG: UDP-N-acetylmuramoyl-L-alanyl-D-glutamate--2,6-diaminopimelate ligase, partial [Pseudomonadota bacterium]